MDVIEAGKCMVMGKDLTGVLEFQALVRRFRALRDQERKIAALRTAVWNEMAALHAKLEASPGMECPLWLRSEYGTKPHMPPNNQVERPGNPVRSDA